mgnify:FL=1
MAYLNKKQYEYRRESAEARNMDNESIAIDHGMNEDQAHLISELCSVRHELHCNIDRLTDSCEDMSIASDLQKVEDDINNSGLPHLNVAEQLQDIDDMDGLINYYGDDVPEDHDSEEYNEWYSENYSRIYHEIENINNQIEDYLREIDKCYHTSFCPTGQLRLY